MPCSVQIHFSIFIKKPKGMFSRDVMLRGMGGVGAFAYAAYQNSVFSAETTKPLLERGDEYRIKPCHHAPKAKAMISLLTNGGPSQLDLFDPKPQMEKYSGKPFPQGKNKLKFDNAAESSNIVQASPFKFKAHGQSGMELSELLPELGEIADDICLIRSMHTGVNNHGQSLYALSSGRPLAGRPSLGSWLSYALHSENSNLPSYMVLKDPHGLPTIGTHNWTSGWLPSLFQGTVVRAKEPRILHLNPPEYLKGEPQSRYLSYVQQLNQKHLNEYSYESELKARISNFELAESMQSAAAEALDISKESKATLEMYGIHEAVTKDYGTRCLIARRLVERGVRYVQVTHNGQPWDHHGNLQKGLPQMCKKTDRPSAALVKDLKALGLLDTTLVHWGGEMGRLPVIQGSASKDAWGRDHNTYGFSMWLAGGGVKAGYVHGRTDDFSHYAVEDIVHHYDYHATLMHLFGYRAEDLTYERMGIKEAITDSQQAKVIHKILA